MDKIEAIIALERMAEDTPILYEKQALTYFLDLAKRVEVERIEKVLYKFNDSHQYTTFISTNHVKTKYPIQHKRWMGPLCKAICDYLEGK